MRHVLTLFVCILAIVAAEAAVVYEVQEGASTRENAELSCSALFEGHLPTPKNLAEVKELAKAYENAQSQKISNKELTCVWLAPQIAETKPDECPKVKTHKAYVEKMLGEDVYVKYLGSKKTFDNRCKRGEPIEGRERESNVALCFKRNQKELAYYDFDSQIELPFVCGKTEQEETTASNDRILVPYFMADVESREIAGIVCGQQGLFEGLPLPKNLKEVKEFVKAYEDHILPERVSTKERTCLWLDPQIDPEKPDKCPKVSNHRKYVKEMLGQDVFVKFLGNRRTFDNRCKAGKPIDGKERELNVAVCFVRGQGQIGYYDFDSTVKLPYACLREEQQITTTCVYDFHDADSMTWGKATAYCEALGDGFEIPHSDQLSLLAEHDIEENVQRTAQGVWLKGKKKTVPGPRKRKYLTTCIRQRCTIEPDVLLFNITDGESADTKKKNPTYSPTSSPSSSPSISPSANPTMSPTLLPTLSPTPTPTEAICVFPYCPDEDIENTTGYLAEHALVAVDENNVGTAKWVPANGCCLDAIIEDGNGDGLIDSISFSGTLINTGFKNSAGFNKTLEIMFTAFDPVSFASCSLEGGTGSLNCPKCELGLCDVGDPFRNWTYFQNVTGKIFGEDISSLTQIQLPNNICHINIVNLPLPQLGKPGANAKNNKLGFSVWFNCDGAFEAGDTELHIADLNLDIKPCPLPTASPTTSPTLSPSLSPTLSPTISPVITPSPTRSPSISPTTSPSSSPSDSPTSSPTVSPSFTPSSSPTRSPSVSPTNSPSEAPTLSPSVSPTMSPTSSPTEAICVFPYCPDPEIEDTPGYLAEHALVAVNEDNVGTAKWVPLNGCCLDASIIDSNGDGLIDSISFSGTLVNTGFMNSPGVNKTLQIEFSAFDSVGFDSCAFEGGSGSLNCPKCELGLCDNGDPFKNWTYFQNATGKIFGEDITSLTEIQLPNNICHINIDNLPLPQLGIPGANAKNDKLGFSVWFNCDGGPSAGDTEIHIADLNLDIKPCPDRTPEPTASPTFSPTRTPNLVPTPSPTRSPTASPSKSPTTSPSQGPSTSPTRSPTTSPTLSPTESPTDSPTDSPTAAPSESPTRSPTRSPNGPTPSPTRSPTNAPTRSPSQSPTDSPTMSPSMSPTGNPTQSPSASPSASPSPQPTRTPNSPTPSPTATPTDAPTTSPTRSPTNAPTMSPTNAPSGSPTQSPSASPTTSPSVSPSNSPTEAPTGSPTRSPTNSPTSSPSAAPTDSPTESPTSSPTSSPTASPSQSPTPSPNSPTPSPTMSPTNSPTASPSASPTNSPTSSPSTSPSSSPTSSPTNSPSASPSRSPTASPTRSPTISPTLSPTSAPTRGICAYPYLPDTMASTDPNYLNEHFLVSVDDENQPTAKWVPVDETIPIFFADTDGDGWVDEITLNGTLINTGFAGSPGVNKTLQIEFKVSGMVTFENCSLQGGNGTLDCPKCELGFCNPPKQPFLFWKYFTDLEGRISGEDMASFFNSSMPPDECIMDISGLPLVQLGKAGANAKDHFFGLSTWLRCDGDPDPGQNDVHRADINIDILPCLFGIYGDEYEPFDFGIPFFDFGPHKSSGGKGG